MDDPSDVYKNQIKDLYGFSDEVWSVMEALSEAERNIRDIDKKNMDAHIRHTVDSLPDTLRRLGYEVPEGMRFKYE